MHDIYRKSIKTPADENTMIRYQSQHQLPIEEFQTPFELHLSRENRWVKLATSLPWDALVKIYCRALSRETRATGEKSTHRDRCSNHQTQRGVG